MFPASEAGGFRGELVAEGEGLRDLAVPEADCSNLAVEGSNDALGCTPKDAAGCAYFIHGPLACVGEGVFAVPIIHAGGGGKLAIDAGSVALSFAGFACFGAAVDGKSVVELGIGVVLFDGAVVLKQSG